MSGLHQNVLPAKESEVGVRRGKIEFSVIEGYDCYGGTRCKRASVTWVSARESISLL